MKTPKLTGAQIIINEQGVEMAIIPRSEYHEIMHYIEYASQFTPKKESKTIEERREIFNDSILEFINDYPSLMLGEFFHYWSEHSATAKKMRFEKEKVFDIKKRLERWNKNQKTFNNGKPTKQTRHDKFESAFNRADENSSAVETFDKV